MTRLGQILGRNDDDILKELGINVPPENKGEILQAIDEYFRKVVLETVLLNISEEEKGALADAVAEDKDLNEELDSITERSPGMKEKIKEAVVSEFNILKASKS